MSALEVTAMIVFSTIYFLLLGVLVNIIFNIWENRK